MSPDNMRRSQFKINFNSQSMLSSGLWLLFTEQRIVRPLQRWLIEDNPWCRVNKVWQWQAESRDSIHKDQMEAPQSGILFHGRQTYSKVYDSTMQQDILLLLPLLYLKLLILMFNISCGGCSSQAVWMCTHIIWCWSRKSLEECSAHSFSVSWFQSWKSDQYKHLVRLTFLSSELD